MPRVKLDAKYDDRLSEIGRRLRTVRNTVQLSQEQMAEMLGFSRRRWVSWEYGEITVPIWALFEMTEKFGIDPDWVIRGGSESPKTISPTTRIDTRHTRISTKVTRMVKNLGLVVSSEFQQKLVKLVFEQPEENEREALANVLAMLRELAIGKGPFT
jgi:transcriptional regulator with XRE-family HTH domain